MRYESRRGKNLAELTEMDKKIKRKAWWADRLGEVSSVILGGSTGYGAGKAIQNIFGWKGIGGNNTPEGPTNIGGAENSGGNTNLDQGNTTTKLPDLPGEPSGETLAENIGNNADSSLGIGGGEGIGNADHFLASDYNWNASEMGWLGNKVALGGQGGPEGILQKEFFSELFNQVPQNDLMGQAAGNTVNQYLRQAYYGGVNPTEAAQNAAKALLGQ
jgi:hypothetical protein